MDLRGTNIRDTYGNVVTIGEVAGKPTAGFLQNGDGERLTDVSVAGTFTADSVNVGANNNISDANGITGELVNATTAKATDFYTKGVGTYKGDGTGVVNAPNNFIKFHWVNDVDSPYLNLPNNVDYTFPYRTNIQLGTTYDGSTETNGTDFWEVANENQGGTATGFIPDPVFRFRGKAVGYYEFQIGIRLYDLFNNVDVVSKVYHVDGTSSAPFIELDGILVDTKFSEATADHLITGSNIFYTDTTLRWFTVTVNVSANNPYPSEFFNTPPYLICKYLGNP